MLYEGVHTIQGHRVVKVKEISRKYGMSELQDLASMPSKAIKLDELRLSILTPARGEGKEIRDLTCTEVNNIQLSLCLLLATILLHSMQTQSKTELCIGYREM